MKALLPNGESTVIIIFDDASAKPVPCENIFLTKECDAAVSNKTHPMSPRLRNIPLTAGGARNNTGPRTLYTSQNYNCPCEGNNAGTAGGAGSYYNFFSGWASCC